MLVTGSSGFIGGALLPALADHADVIALSRRQVDAPPQAGITSLVGDITQVGWSDRLPPADVVVHLAAVSPRSEGRGSVDPFRRVNEEGTLGVLEYARAGGATKFIYASTGSVYAPSGTPIEETAPVSPADDYARSKLNAEAMCRSYARYVPGMTTLRLFHPYGPGQSDGFLFPRLMSRVRDGHEITITPAGPRLTMMYIGDLVDVLVELVLREAEPGYRVLNVGSDDPATIEAIAKTIGAELGRSPAIQMSAGPETSLVADLYRLHRTVEARPAVSLAEGVRRMLAAHGH